MPGTGRTLRITTVSQPGDLTTVVRLSGEVDADSSRTLDHQLRTRMPVASRYLIVDLSEVTLMGAAGIRVLLEHTKRLAGSGRRMLTVASTPHMVRLLRLTEATGALNIHPSMPSAMIACLTRFDARGTGTPSG
ncbi:STAS domain-containing protein [Actinocrispum sp. NPDC049592]|uniref:STAS domain-containing protein n=1 Tax=Actinocrispum sp. NPDC049592 TaxID=3154835 RepID=UPI0034294DC5